jgi:MscS family membrane protein
MEYLHYIFFDNSLRNLLIVFGSILIVLICKKPLSRYLASLLFIPIQKKWKSVAKDEFIGLIINPLGRFLFVGFTIIALSNLNYPHSLSFTLLNHSINKIFISLGNCTVIIFLFGSYKALSILLLWF